MGKSWKKRIRASGPQRRGFHPHELPFDALFNDMKGRLDLDEGPPCDRTDAVSVDARMLWLANKQLELQAMTQQYPRGGPESRAIAQRLALLQAERLTLKDLRAARNRVVDRLDAGATVPWRPDNVVSLLAAMRALVRDLVAEEDIVLEADEQKLVDAAQHYLRAHAHEIA